MTTETEKKERPLPTLSHACVGAIVYRESEAGRQYLIQRRDKPGTQYDGKWEFPVGILEDSPNARISAPLQALREVQEEAGLDPDQTEIVVDEEITYTSSDGDVVLGFRPYFQAQQLVGGHPWIMSVFLVRADPQALIGTQSDETSDVHWVDEGELKRMLMGETDTFFPLQVPALQYHLLEDKTSN